MLIGIDLVGKLLLGPVGLGLFTGLPQHVEDLVLVDFPGRRLPAGSSAVPSSTEPLLIPRAAPVRSQHPHRIRDRAGSTAAADLMGGSTRLARDVASWLVLCQVLVRAPRPCGRNLQR